MLSDPVGGELRAAPGVTAAVEGRPASLPAPLAVPEQVRHTVTVESLDGGAVELRHRDPLVLREAARAPDGRFLSTAVAFDGQVGASRFEVWAGGAPAFWFEVAVRPTKVDWEHDYQTMLREVDAVAAGLAGEYLRATTQPAVTAPRSPDAGGWLTLLQRTLPDLDRALGYVAAHPRSGTRAEPVVRRLSRVTAAGPAFRRAVRAGSGSGEREPVGAVWLRERVQAGAQRPTLDTPEHRWLVFQMHGVLRSLEALHRTEAELPRSARREHVLHEIEQAREHVAPWLRRLPLSEAEAGLPPGPPSPQLLRAPGYAEAYAALQRLRFALRFALGPLASSARDLHLLYELWAYLTLAREVAAALDEPVPSASLFRAEAHGVRLLLGRGQRHALRFGSGVRLLYNPRFGAGLAPQRPDFVIEVEAPGRARRRYVLDAKYRRDDAVRYRRRYGVPGPPEDALGDLHRYRDAIVERGRRTVAEAVALYPWRTPEDGAFEQSRLWRSIPEIGVGAIPLLPGQTAWLSAWLRRVLPAPP